MATRSPMTRCTPRRTFLACRSSRDVAPWYNLVTVFVGPLNLTDTQAAVQVLMYRNNGAAELLWLKMWLSEHEDLAALIQVLVKNGITQAFQLVVRSDVYPENNSIMLHATEQTVLCKPMSVLHCADVAQSLVAYNLNHPQPAAPITSIVKLVFRTNGLVYFEQRCRDPDCLCNFHGAIIDNEHQCFKCDGPMFVVAAFNAQAVDLGTNEASDITVCSMTICNTLMPTFSHLEVLNMVEAYNTSPVHNPTSIPAVQAAFVRNGGDTVQAMLETIVEAVTITLNSRGQVLVLELPGSDNTPGLSYDLRLAGVQPVAAAVAAEEPALVPGDEAEVEPAMLLNEIDAANAAPAAGGVVVGDSDLDYDSDMAEVV